MTKPLIWASKNGKTAITELRTPGRIFTVVVASYPSKVAPRAISEKNVEAGFCCSVMELESVLRFAPLADGRSFGYDRLGT